jgi:hypothetical protein
VSDLIWNGILAVGILAASGTMVFVWLVYGPSIDDAFQWTAPRFVAAVRAHLPPDAIGSDAQWWVTRFDDGRRRVSCAMPPRDGLSAFHWEVSEGFSPAESYAARPGFFVVPLTRATFARWPGGLPIARLHLLPDAPCWVGSLILRELGVAPTTSFFGGDGGWPDNNALQLTRHR